MDYMLTLATTYVPLIAYIDIVLLALIRPPPFYGTIIADLCRAPK